MARYMFIVSYDGTDYCGWQKQKEHKYASELPSLQETIELALAKIFKENISLSASGRTDAGVHAIAQVCHFETDKAMPKDLCWATRAYLPASITIKKVFTAPSDFHSTLSAERKTYRYWVWNQQRSTALLARFSYWVRKPLDLDFLNSCSSRFVGIHDFKSFQSVGTPVHHTEREIFSATWRRKNNSLVEFEITGSGFLKQMVRNIVGTQLDLALKQQSADRILEILALKDRTKAGTAAPAQGLFLKRVYYPPALVKQCRVV